jgi:hypothetical protein
MMVLKHSGRERIKVWNEYVRFEITLSGPFLEYGIKPSGSMKAEITIL